MLKVLDTTGATFSKTAEDMPLDQILIEGLTLPAFIGMFAHEYDAPQPIRFDVTIDIAPLNAVDAHDTCLLYTSPSPRDKRQSRMPSSA